MGDEKHFKLRDDLKITFNGATLYRIEALRDIPTHNVNTGDIGGYVEKEENLSGNAWLSGDAKVFGDAEVSDNAEVCGHAKAYGHARVYGNAKVFGDAKVFDNAQVFDNAAIAGNAKVFGDATVRDYSVVLGDAEVSDNGFVFGRSWVSGGEIKSPTDSRNIIGEQYSITILPRLIQIGCQCHTKEEWWGFTDKEILAMDGRDGLKWWKKWKPILMAICEENQKGD